MNRESLQQAAALVAGGGVVAFTGAGISAESGIPTFRDPGGFWDRFDPTEFGTWDGLSRTAGTRPAALASFLAELRRALAEARPGPAHVALARLEVAGLLDAVITQNVDGLHQEAGSARVIELHGSFAREVCLACGHRALVDRAAFLEDLDRSISALRSVFVSGLADVLPRCPACGGPARPDFVAFGEAVHHLEEAEALARASRVLLVVGTSGEVFPAAQLPEEARAAGARVLEVATGPTFVEAHLRLEGMAGAVLPAIVHLTLAGS